MRLWKNKTLRVILCSLVLLFLILQACVINLNKDFDVFTGASRLVFEGKTCYNVWLKSGTSGLKYFYSPLFAVILFPLKDMPQGFNNVLWLFFNLFFLYRTFRLFSFFLEVEKWEERKRFAFNALCLLASARFILDNLFLAQMTPFLIWATLESARLFFEKKHLPGAALLALIINIKIIPLAVLVYLAYKKWWKPLGLVVVFSGIYLILPAIFIGYQFNAELLKGWFNVLTQTTSNSIYEDSCRPGFSSWIPSLLMDTEVQFDSPRNFLNLSEGLVKTINYIISLLLLMILAVAFGKPFQSVNTRQKLFYDLSLVCLATPLVFPHQGKYALLYTLPAYAWCIFRTLPHLKKEGRARSMSSAILFLVLSFVLLTMTTDGLIGRRLSDVSEYHHLLTYGSLCLLMSALLLRPKKNSKEFSEV